MDVARLKHISYIENKIICTQFCVDAFIKQALERTDTLVKNGQPRNIDNTGNKTQNED